MLVTGIGQCSWDYLGIVDRFPEQDTKPELRTWEEQGGGPVATALVTLRRFGVSARFFGVVGDDGEGAKVRDALVAEGIDADGLIVREGASTQKAFIAVERGSGKRTIFWRRATGRPIRFAELGEGVLDRSDFLHLDGLMGDVSLKAAGAARTRGIPVMLDAGRMREGIVELAARCTYVVSSEVFARELGYDDDPEEFIKRVRTHIPGVFTFTLGEKGSITYAGDKIIRQPAFPVEVVDTTGAGDVFHGAYIYGILNGWSIEKILRTASAAAGLSCTRLGGRAGIPTRRDLEEFMEITLQ